MSSERGFLNVLFLNDACRALKYEAWRPDEIIVRELKHELDSGLLHLDPYLQRFLGSGNPCVDALLKTVLIFLPVLRSDTTAGLSLRGITLADHTNGKKLTKIRKFFYLLMKFYLPLIIPVIFRQYPSLKTLWKHPRLRLLISAVHTMNFLLFLRNGEYATLCDRLFRIGIVKKRLPVSSGSIAGLSGKEAMWTTFSLLFISSFVFVPWRLVFLILRALKASVFISTDSTLASRKCFVCCGWTKQPLKLSCEHEFCYSCIQTVCRVVAINRVFCPVCLRLR